MNKEELQKEIDAIKANLNDLKNLFKNACETLQQAVQNQKNSQKEILTVEEAAEWTCISPDSINYYVQNRLIPHKKIGKHTRFSKSILLKWIEEDMQDVMKNFRKKT
jgi:excisionase family DNA binding protein